MSDCVMASMQAFFQQDGNDCLLLKEHTDTMLNSAVSNIKHLDHQVMSPVGIPVKSNFIIVAEPQAFSMQFAPNVQDILPLLRNDYQNSTCWLLGKVLYLSALLEANSSFPSHWENACIDAITQFSLPQSVCKIIKHPAFSCYIWVIV